MTEYQQLSIDETGDCTVVNFRQPRISGVWETERLSQELYQLVEKEHRTSLVLDFSSVEFLSSQVFGTLVGLNGKVKARNGFLRLCNIQPKVLEVLLTCKLDQLFDIRPDLPSALEVS
jgi:anti-sigma B factor antagonist